MNIQPIDWSATAAWIAVIISIIGASVGPFFTACINNKHQLKLRELDIKEKELSEYNAKRRTAIENFLSSTSRYLTDGHSKNMDECGNNFFQVYPETKSQGLFHQIQEEVTFCGLLHEAYA